MQNAGRGKRGNHNKIDATEFVAKRYTNSGLCFCAFFDIFLYRLLIPAYVANAEVFFAKFTHVLENYCVASARQSCAEMKQMLGDGTGELDGKDCCDSWNMLLDSQTLKEQVLAAGFRYFEGVLH